MPMTQERSSQRPPSPAPNVDASEYDGGLSVFFKTRPRLFGIAYRMLGVSTPPSPRTRAAKPMSEHGFPSRWTPVPIRVWVRSAATH
jgi:hypothetical protein